MRPQCAPSRCRSIFSAVRLAFTESDLPSGGRAYALGAKLPRVANEGGDIVREVVVGEPEPIEPTILRRRMRDWTIPEQLLGIVHHSSQYTCGRHRMSVIVPTPARPPTGRRESPTGW